VGNYGRAGLETQWDGEEGSDNGYEHGGGDADLERVEDIHDGEPTSILEKGVVKEDNKNGTNGCKVVKSAKYVKEQEHAIQIYSINVRGLKTDERIKELLDEFKAVDWDVILVSETWRPETEEIWELEDGHWFMGAGCRDERRGVAIIVHSRWKKHVERFEPVNERLSFADVDFDGLRLRVIATYFPDSSYSNGHVEKVYIALDECIDQARRQRRHIALGGDFNAEVGSAKDDDSYETLGKYGMASCNARGEWLKTWATTAGMIITNTHFKHRFGHRYTHVGTSGRKRQIDYMLVSEGLWANVWDALLLQRSIQVRTIMRWVLL
jgi:exonuclease III